MRLYTIDSDYLSYLYGVDPQILQNHQQNNNWQGRVCVVEHQDYKGAKSIFAIPIKGEVDLNKTDGEYYVPIGTHKSNGFNNSGFLVNKAIFVDHTLIRPLQNASDQYRKIGKDITQKENELKVKLVKFLTACEHGQYIKNSTDLDRQQLCYKSRMTLKNAGMQDEEIYQLSFSALLQKASDLNKSTQKKHDEQSAASSIVKNLTKVSNNVHIDVELSEDVQVAQILITCKKRLEVEVAADSLVNVQQARLVEQVGQVQQVEQVSKSKVPQKVKQNLDKGK